MFTLFVVYVTFCGGKLNMLVLQLILGLNSVYVLMLICLVIISSIKTESHIFIHLGEQF